MFKWDVAFYNTIDAHGVFDEMSLPMTGHRSRDVAFPKVSEKFEMFLVFSVLFCYKWHP
jgi:hypothetical protein